LPDSLAFLQIVHYYFQLALLSLFIKPRTQTAACFYASIHYFDLLDGKNYPQSSIGQPQYMPPLPDTWDSGARRMMRAVVFSKINHAPFSLSTPAACQKDVGLFRRIQSKLTLKNTEVLTVFCRKAQILPAKSRTKRKD